MVELSGGNDGLNTVVPFGLDGYTKHRKALRLNANLVQKVTKEIGLHPAMGGMSKLVEDGKLAIVQGVGYPNPDRSHFRSMEIWHTASVEPTPPTSGWLGRCLDATEPKGNDAPPRGMSLTGSLPQAFQADKVVVPVVEQLDAFKPGGLAVSGIRQDHAIRQAPAADLVDDVQRQFPLGTKYYLGGDARLLPALFIADQGFG